MATVSHADMADVLKDILEELLDDMEYGGDITIEKQTTPNTGMAATYVLKKNGVALNPKIDIPDVMVERLLNISLKTCATANNPLQGLNVGDKYLDFRIFASDNSEDHLYVKLTDLMDVYVADESTLTLNNNQFKVKDNGVGTQQLAGNSVTAFKLANDCVTNGKIVDTAVTTSKLRDGCVTTDKLKDASVTADKMAGFSVSNGMLAQNCVSNGKIMDGAVTSAKIYDNSVTTAKIKDSNVTLEKMATASVNTDKLVDSAVTTGKLDVQAVTQTKIANDAVTTGKIADNAVTTAKIKDAGVTTEKIKDYNVTADKLASESVTNGKLAPASVSNGKIIDGAVTELKLSDNVRALIRDRIDKAIADAMNTFDLKENTHIVMRNLSVQTNYGKTGEEIAIQARLLDQNNDPVPNAYLVFDIDGERSPYMTNSSGNAGFNYACTGSGKHTLNVSCYDIQMDSSYVFYDCRDYDIGNSANHNDAWIDQERFERNYTSEYTELSSADSDVAQSYLPIPHIVRTSPTIRFDVYITSNASAAFVQLREGTTVLSSIKLSDMNLDLNTWHTIIISHIGSETATVSNLTNNNRVTISTVDCDRFYWRIANESQKIRYKNWLYY